MGTVAFSSIEDLRLHCQALSARRVEDDPLVIKLQSAKQLTWLAMLAGTFLCYYLIDAMQQALSILS